MRGVWCWLICGRSELGRYTSILLHVCCLCARWGGCSITHLVSCNKGYFLVLCAPKGHIWPTEAQLQAKQLTVAQPQIKNASMQRNNENNKMVVALLRHKQAAQQLTWIDKNLKNIWDGKNREESCKWYFCELADLLIIIQSYLYIIIFV